MQSLILDVRCVDNEYTDRPDSVCITMTDELANTLLAHMDNVTKLGVHAIEILNNSGEWLNSDEYTKEELLEKFESNDYEDIVENMECHSIKIFANYCRLYATPKHCGDAEECYSDRISKEQLLTALAA